MVGKTISHYKVLEKIGQGGMGEVYRAEDTNLSREVAIKVLPEQFTQDPQRLARFEREAKLLASLNHPNIAAIHSFEHSDDVHFLVLELVPGETLAERVAKGPLPVEEALEVCRQIAEGVEAAHERGVIHRDLKPANVKVTPEGKVKILDFGLAKAFEDEASVTDISQSPTLTEEMTRAGVILGTAAYMSPEQARGKPVDKRADIFAFGAVLYELLTGKRTFEGETITETIAAVLKSEPDWDALPGDTPWNIRTLLRRCLHKETRRRVQHVGDVRIEIEEALTGPSRASPTGIDSTVQSRPRLTMIGLAVLTSMITGLAVWNVMRPSPPIPRDPTRFVITASRAAPLGDIAEVDVAISPDGRHIVYVVDRQGTNHLYLRSLDGFVDKAISGTEGVSGGPFFKPDGQTVAFFTAGELKKISLTGESSATLFKDPGIGISAMGTWGHDDTIIFSAALSDGQGLYRISAAGGEPQTFATVDPAADEQRYTHPQFLPGGKALLFTVTDTNNDYHTSVLSIETGERKIVLKGAYAARYATTGHLVYLER